MSKAHTRSRMRRKYKLFIYLTFLAVLFISAYFWIPKYFGASLYPLTYQTEIIQSSQEFGVDPNFIAAVIYTESHFNANAHSGAGAIGLMQIMPKTGSSIAKQLNDSSFTVAKLYEPARNIRYGTYYLKQLLSKYGNSEKLVLMHYNGGNSAVNSYRTRGTLPRETQGFVRKVTSAENVYSTVYGEWWEPKETFPEMTTVKTAKPTIKIQEFWRSLISSKGGW